MESHEELSAIRLYMIASTTRVTSPGYISRNLNDRKYES